jgi:hypothetical protein
MAEVGNVQAGLAGPAEAAPVPGRFRVQVVPLRGLPIVAAVVVFVIASVIAFTVARYSSPPHAAS